MVTFTGSDAQINDAYKCGGSLTESHLKSQT